MTFSLPNRWDAPLFAAEHLKIQLFWRNQSSQVFLVFCKLPSVTAAIAWLRVFNLLFHWILYDSTLLGTDIHMAAKCVASAPSAKMMLPLRVKIPWLFRQKCYILRNCQKNYHVFFQENWDDWCTGWEDAHFQPSTTTKHLSNCILLFHLALHLATLCENQAPIGYCASLGNHLQNWLHLFSNTVFIITDYIPSP